MGSLTIHELPESERPREKLARLGAGALSDAELIAILLRVGVKGTNAIELARQLLRDHGSLAGSGALQRARTLEDERRRPRQGGATRGGDSDSDIGSRTSHRRRKRWIVPN
jgi:hypothetical protein